MKNQEISRQIQRFESLYKKAGDACNDNLDLQSHWSRYLCILLSGLIENSIKEIYSNYIVKNSAKAVADYAIAYLSTVSNPKTEKILSIVGSFKKEWQHDLEIYVSDNGRKDAIDSVMANRHLIAHGKDVGLTIARLNQFFIRVIEVLEHIESQCNPDL
jgi:hypothetical protein